MSVLTVGSMVFSSNPRIAVLTDGTWSLEIIQVREGDEGEYQCQVNTEPKKSAVVRLVVRGM